MASRFSLEADIQPTIDDKAAEREAQELGKTMESELGDLAIGTDGSVGSLGGARGGGGGGVGTAAAGGSLLGSAGGALSKVALGGAVGFGILTATEKLAQASPALKQTNAMFGQAMSLFFRPFGNFLSGILRPFAQSALQMAVNFNDLYSQEGLGMAISKISEQALTSLAGAFANAAGDIGSGEGTLSDLLLLASGGLTAKWLLGKMPTIGLGALFTKLTGRQLGRLLPSVGIGSVLGGLSKRAMLGKLAKISIFSILGSIGGRKLGKLLGETELGGLLGGLAGPTLAKKLGQISIGRILTALGGSAGATAAGSLIALLGGVISISDLIDGDISDWNFPAKFGEAVGKEVRKNFPNVADIIEEQMTDNQFADAGEQVAESLDDDEKKRVINLYPGGGGDGGISIWDAFTGVQLGGVPGTAQGGVARGPQIREVGEAGPEAIMPLDDLNRQISQAIRQAMQSMGAQNQRDGNGNMARKLDAIVTELQRTRRAIESQDLTVEEPTGELDPFN